MHMKRWEIYLDMIMELLVIAAGAVLLVFVVPRCLDFYGLFVAGMDHCNDRSSGDRISGKEDKAAEKVRFGHFDRGGRDSDYRAAVFLCTGEVTMQVIQFIQGFPDFQKDFIVQFDFFRQKIEYILEISAAGSAGVSWITFFSLSAAELQELCQV